jgi:haloalkane dehalogenase
MASDEQCRLLTAEEIPEDLLARSRNRTGFEEEYPFRPHWFRSSDGIQHYVDEGEGPVLLFVHGNPTWSFAWRRLLARLKSRFRVIAVDHLGCGFSQSPADRNLYTLDGHISRLETLVRLLDLNAVTLFAHDWGGAIGMGCAGRQSERFSRFMLMNTGAFRSQAIPFRIAVCRIPLLGRLANQGLGIFARAALSMATESGMGRAARRGFMAPWESWASRRAMQEFVLDIPLHRRHRSYSTLTEVEDSLAKFQQHPMKLIWGMRDWCFTPEEFLAGFLQRFPHADVCRIADAGHYIFEDAPEQLLAEAESFLDQVSSGPSTSD